MNWHPGAAAAAGQQEKLLSPHQVATMLQCSSRQVRRLFREGKLEGIALGERRIRFRRAHVDAYLLAINTG
jgi:excisionase family DNA binding protein